MSFIMMTSGAKDFKNILNTFSMMKNKIPKLKEQFAQYSKRIAEYDSIGAEVIQVLLVSHLINLLSKYKSENPRERLDAFNSAMLLAVVNS